MKIGNHSIEVLPAGYGDSIFLSLMRDRREYNILIDGGLAKTYFDAKNKKRQKGPLKLLLDKLKEEGRCVDLLVVTQY